MKFLQLIFFTVAAATTNSRGVEAQIELPRQDDLKVKRHLLEKHHPAFKTFKGDMHAGLIPAVLDSADSSSDDFSSYMFWMFQPDVDASTETFRSDTLVIWLNGGPGCSSFTGLLTENGPVTVPKFRAGIPSPNPASGLDAPLIENPYAWTKKSAMIFVEQPGGTGFSTASSQWTGEEADKRTQDDVAKDFYAFLQNLYTVFGEGLAEKKIYITGESYAGMYIPSIARGIYLGNKNLETKSSSSSSSLHFVDIRGVAIGNGWIDVDTQGPTAIDHAWWHGMIDLPTRRVLHERWNECITGMITDSSEMPFHSFTTPDECGIMSAVLQAAGNPFVYDVSTYDAYPSIVGDPGVIGDFFNNKDVQQAINVKQTEYWQQCVPGSGRRRLLQDSPLHRLRQLVMLDHDRRSVLPWIAELLDDAKIDVLVYNGDLDLACTSQGTELSLEAMNWSGKEDWKDPQATKWYNWINADQQPAGHAKKLKNLEFLVVYNSGHFVPVNQAEHALDMIGRLLDGKSFQDVELPRFMATKKVGTVIGSGSAVVPSTSLSSIVWSPVGVIGFMLGAATAYVILLLRPKLCRLGRGGYQELSQVQL